MVEKLYIIPTHEDKLSIYNEVNQLFQMNIPIRVKPLIFNLDLFYSYE